MTTYNLEELNIVAKEAVRLDRLTISNALVEALEGKKKPENVIECCENCGGEGYGKAWYGRGRETGDAWGDRYVPTGSVVFCRECKPNFRIGAEWNGEEIWKTTSDSPEHDQLRISRITKTVNVEHNQALTEAQNIIKQLLESKKLSDASGMFDFPNLTQDELESNN